VSLRETLSGYWAKLQGELFPFLEDEVGPLTPMHRQLVLVLDMAPPESFLPHLHGLVGRPMAERAALARAFMAKGVFNLPTTTSLIERIHMDKTLRRLCGWERRSQVPSEATFSRAFAEFAAGDLASRMHETLIKDTFGDQVMGHVARDSTAIHGREKPFKIKDLATSMPEPAVKRKRGRPKKGEEVPARPPRRLERQAAGMSLPDMLADLPRTCDVGVKRNASGYQETWIGYKLHIDTADGDIPVSCVLTSASVHDSQVAIPLAVMTAGRITHCYDLMDSAYDAPEIHQHSRSLGHVPIIDVNTRRNTALKAERNQEQKRQTLVGHPTPESIRYNQRGAAERVNANLKDNHGGNTVRVRGPQKVMCHLMFGILTITIIQTMRLIL
jgi:hypothetical protein